MSNRSLDVYAGKQLMGQFQDSNGFWSFNNWTMESVKKLDD
ncbi:hypothetical protein [Pseudoalteromonas arctica]|nr:hypothetical protein [Pseudoalteromonas arctica]